MVYDLTMNIWRRNGRLTGAGKLCQREIAHQVHCEPLPLFRASTVGLPSRSACFITSSSSTSREAMSQQSTSCWIRRCNRQYIFLPQFTLVSRCRVHDEKCISLKLVRKLHLRSPQTQSPHCLSSGWTRAAGGQMIAPILSRKRDNRERSFFPQKKGSQWTHSIPSRTERACSLPKHITHRLCVSSSVRQRWHGSTHLLKRFSTDISTHTSETRSPEGKKRMMCSTGALLCSQTLISLRHRHPPANVRCIGCCNHASGNRSHWRRSQSDPQKRTQCRVPFGRELRWQIIFLGATEKTHLF